MRVFDPAVLRRLTEDGGERASRGFVLTYRRLLPTRLRRLAAALGVAGGAGPVPPDLEQARDAALSLSAASSMLGLRELADLAHRLADAARDGDLDVVRRLWPGIAPAATRADRALALHRARADAAAS
ncbi:Hpt domain-containing protein [Nocardioides sp.]|uniref:Hpt domain-containing protein n=1 Tax=Nocardioides sp. TaxID=35761 RepID=UPI0035136892